MNRYLESNKDTGSRPSGVRNLPGIGFGVGDSKFNIKEKPRQNRYLKIQSTKPRSGFVQDIGDMGRNVVDTIISGGKEALTEYKASLEGRRDPVKAGFDIAGTVASTPLKAAGDILFGLGKAVLSEEQEEKVASKTKEVFTKLARSEFGQEVDESIIDKAVAKYKTLTPDQKKDLETAGDFGEVFLELLGGKAFTSAKRGVQNIRRTRKQIKQLEGFPYPQALFEQPKKLPVKGGEATKVPVKTPATPEPYVPDSELPTIPFGARAKDTLPVIDADTGQLRVPGRKAADDISIEPIRETPSPVSEKVTPEIREKVVEKRRELPKFERQTNVGQEEAILKKSIQEIEDIATGKVVSEDGIPANAHLSVLRNIADERAATGDISLQKRLINLASEADRRAGQELQASNIVHEGSISKMLSDIKIKMEDQIPDSVKTKRTKELNSIKTNLKRALDDVKKTAPTRSDIIKAVDNITCK